MTASHRSVVVVIATPLETEMVALIEAVDGRLDVRYQPDLLPPTRFACDHRGVESFSRNAGQEARWRAMLADAEVLFGLPGDSPTGLADAVRAGAGLRWVQATAGGAGEQVAAAGLTDDELSRVVITRTGGVHAGPLAEFAVFGLLAFTKALPRLRADQAARRWAHYPMAELAGATVLIVGLGAIGNEVARLAKAFGMRVIAINRSGRTDSPYVDEARPPRFLADLLPVAHGVVLTLPLTEETRGMIDARAIARMRTGAVLVDVGRGGVVDEAALVQALQQGRLAGAALDVFATEPLPADSALWSLPNVLVSPHTAGLSARENERIMALFTENLRRYLAGDELISRVEPTLGY
ncbi:MAG: D-2-hydroxyacid dehydrogenase [Actinomycetota bacterium]|nr:D-2-hydroxyacid dehydrogenase [Actinomycetota bacterium]